MWSLLLLKSLFSWAICSYYPKVFSSSPSNTAYIPHVAFHHFDFENVSNSIPSKYKVPMLSLNWTTHGEKPPRSFLPALLYIWLHLLTWKTPSHSSYPRQTGCPFSVLLFFLSCTRHCSHCNWPAIVGKVSNVCLLTINDTNNMQRLYLLVNIFPEPGPLSDSWHLSFNEHMNMNEFKELSLENNFLKICPLLNCFKIVAWRDSREKILGVKNTGGYGWKFSFVY